MKQKDFIDNDGVSHVVTLDSCPYCGSAASIIPIGNSHTKIRKIHIKCDSRKCGNKGFTVGAIHHDFRFCITKAAEKWNARA